MSGLMAIPLALTTCGTPDELPPGVARVIEVIDGDTLEVVVGRQQQRVRLLGIDTPETVHPTRPVECFGPEASAELARLAPPGTELRLERDTELRDRYGRLLAYATLPDGTFVNEALLSAGFATTLHIDPNGAHRARLATAEAAARTTGAGLWSACPAR
jgi:micrococcal nuclease